MFVDCEVVHDSIGVTYFLPPKMCRNCVRARANFLLNSSTLSPFVGQSFKTPEDGTESS